MSEITYTEAPTINRRIAPVYPKTKEETARKLDRYKWTATDRPGEQVMVELAVLNVDRWTYQRDGHQEGKILRMAREWSYVACGSLTVARRKDATLWVVDGQNRMMAAQRRGITHLPANIYDVDGIAAEADAFYRVNCNRKPLPAYNKWKAKLAQGDLTAIALRDLAQAAGRSISPTNASNGETIACITAITRCLNEDRARLERIWPLVCQLTSSRIMHNELIEGLFYMEGHMPEAASITQAKWKNRILEAGFDRLRSGIQEAASYYKKGGAKVWARGIVDTINHRLHRKLELV